jgi:hypothetical protein
MGGSIGQRYGIPLFLVVISDCVSSMERTRGCIVYGYEMQVVLRCEVSKIVVDDAQGTKNQQLY